MKSRKFLKPLLLAALVMFGFGLLAANAEFVEKTIIRAIVPDKITLADRTVAALGADRFVLLDEAGNINLFTVENGKIRLADSGILTEKNVESPREILRFQHRQTWQ